MSEDTSMTPQEILQMIAELKNEVGRSTAHVSLDISSNPSSSKKPVVGFLRPDGFGKRNETIVVFADSWKSAVDQLRAEWEKRSAEHRTQTVQSLALEIIRLTALNGECTDAALRGSGFDAADVARYGHDACARADEMAQNGPFSITALRGANAA